MGLLWKMAGEGEDQAYEVAEEPATQVNSGRARPQLVRQQSPQSAASATEGNRFIRSVKLIRLEEEPDSMIRIAGRTWIKGHHDE